MDYDTQDSRSAPGTRMRSYLDSMTGYYAADFDQKDNSERKKNSLLQVDQSSVRNSYSVFSLLRYVQLNSALLRTDGQMDTGG
ncbi:hypothetical protein SRHO_G00212870 [Serrasalmus rhombeus]